MVLLPLMFIGGWLLWCNRPWGLPAGRYFTHQAGRPGVYPAGQHRFIDGLATVRQIGSKLCYLQSLWSGALMGLICVSGWHCHSPRRNPFWRTAQLHHNLPNYNEGLCNWCCLIYCYVIRQPPPRSKCLQFGRNSCRSDCKKSKRLKPYLGLGILLPIVGDVTHLAACLQEIPLIWPLGEEVWNRRFWPGGLTGRRVLAN